jgi:acetyltransferase-like isoleucine patch superfamily enzyme
MEKFEGGDLRMEECLFCNIKSEYRIFYKDNIVTAFLAKDAVAPGQSLVIPNRHVQQLSEMSSKEIYSIFRLCSIISSIITKELNYEGVNIILNNGSCAGQTVEHVHIHIVPRRCGDIPNPKYWLNEKLYKRLYQPNEDEYIKISHILKQHIERSSFQEFSLLSNQQIDTNAKIGKNVQLGANIRIYSGTIIADDCVIGDNVIIGHPTTDEIKGFHSETIIGEGSIIRSGTVIYSGVKIGRNLDCGHNALIREHTEIGENVYILPGTQIHSDVTIGDNVRVYGFISNRSIIEQSASVLGLLLHAYREGKGGVIEEAPIVKKGAVVGMGTILIGGVKIGENSIVGAGAVVTKDIPPNRIVVGIPAKEIGERHDE